MDFKELHETEFGAMGVLGAYLVWLLGNEGYRGVIHGSLLELVVKASRLFFYHYHV